MGVGNEAWPSFILNTNQISISRACNVYITDNRVFFVACKELISYWNKHVNEWRVGRYQVSHELVEQKIWILVKIQCGLWYCIHFSLKPWHLLISKAELPCCHMWPIASTCLSRLVWHAEKHVLSTENMCCITSTMGLCDGYVIAILWDSLPRLEFFLCEGQNHGATEALTSLLL